ncbi:MAG: hypothetical protein GX224_06100 [Thermoplasmatales archaeon]|nr:hypothetical protein [Thermoplasmatales archaeon]
MRTVLFDGREYRGPYIPGGAELPAVRAYALVCVEGGEGLKVLTFLHSDDIAAEVANSKWRDCWEKNRNRFHIQVYVLETDDGPEARDAFKREFLDRRLRTMPCDELPPIEDDF